MSSLSRRAEELPARPFATSGDEGSASYAEHAPYTLIDILLFIGMGAVWILASWLYAVHFIAMWAVIRKEPSSGSSQTPSVIHSELGWERGFLIDGPEPVMDFYVIGDDS